MSDIAPARRFVCKHCRREHRAWSARCPSCNVLEGLVRTDAPEVVERRVEAKVIPITTGMPMVEAEARVETTVTETTQEVPRSHLTIVRAPSPDPILEDPIEELTDGEVTPTPVTTSISSSTSEPISLADVAEEDLPRDSTQLAPLDAVLGGGLVVGSAIVLWGDAGTGKSSLVMQMLAGLDLTALIATGEESVQQAGSRARRLGVAARKVLIVAETDLDVVLAHARKARCQILHVDSIQTLTCAAIGGSAGSQSQVKECTRRLVKFAKDSGISVIVTAHATSDGSLAGPTTLKHLVDVVLELEVGPGCGGNERVLRASKNRFGSTAVVGRFELTGDGHVPMDGDGWDDKF